MTAALRGRAPYRVSFGGGGTDLPVVADAQGGAVLNTTIAFYVHATLLPRADRQARVLSVDYDIIAHYDLTSPILDQQSQLRLFDAVISRFAPDQGFDLFVESDAPVGSGLGASGALAVLTTALLARHTRRPSTSSGPTGTMSPYEIAETAFLANRELLGERVGRQDEYAAAFGGINFMEFRREGVTVLPLRLRRELHFEIEHRFLLCHTPAERSPQDPVNEQVRLFGEGRAATVQAMADLRDLAYTMRDHLCREDLTAFAHDLVRAGELKVATNPAAVVPQVEAMLQAAIAAGALGGKLLGAGGGGYLLVVCGMGQKDAVADALEGLGGDAVPFLLDNDGVVTWQVDIDRDDRMHPFYREWLEG
jgi:D-glycero-alpha-D-manno-heptose-7-phosphate kinase